jgi:threonine/homoserine/homoserine lactone efflux protein
MDFSHFLSYFIFLFLWMVSPGPNFALIARTSIKYGVKSGFWVSTGMILCDGLFIILAIFGVAEFLKMHPKILDAAKMIGSAYIIYIGVDIFLSTFKAKVQDVETKETKENTPKKLFIKGFLTDAANPLLIMGMLAIVLTFIDINGGAFHITFYSALIPFTTFYVTFGIAICFGNKIIRKAITPYIKWFERLAGIAICTLPFLL